MTTQDNNSFKYSNLLGSATEQSIEYERLKDALEFQKLFMIYEFSYHLKDTYNISLVLDFINENNINNFCFVKDNIPINLIPFILSESVYNDINQSRYAEHFNVLFDMSRDIADRSNRKFDLIQYPVDNSLNWISIIEKLLDRKDISNKFLSTLLDKSTRNSTMTQKITKI